MVFIFFGVGSWNLLKVYIKNKPNRLKPRKEQCNGYLAIAKVEMILSKNTIHFV